ncbi:MAG: beta-propeller domain-containing protein [Myxococcota bacterium]
MSVVTTVRSLMVLLTVSLLATGCTNDEGSQTDKTPVITGERGLLAFDDCTQMEDYLEEVLVEQLAQSYNPIYADDALAGDGAVSNASANETSAPSTGPSDYTTTNVQEEGIDEADFVKTDGEYIYMAQNGSFTVIRSWPASETAKVAELDLGGYPRSMFLHGDRALVMTDVYGYSYGYGADIEGGDTINGEPDAFFQGHGGTRLTIIDLTDRDDPNIVREIDLQGWMNTGRLIGRDAFLVLNSYIRIPDALWEAVGELDLPFYDYYSASEAERETLMNQARNQLRPIVRQFLAEHDARDWLPQMREGEQLSTMYSCSELYRPGELSHLSVLSLVHLDLDADLASPVTNTGLLADGWTVYASRDNLYVAQSSQWWWGWGDFDLETHIHKFALRNAQGRPQYVGSGAVDGWLLNQFSMSEHDGVLRVATTDNDWSQPVEAQGGNNITILQEDAGQLETIGELRGLAPGEQIYAARMIGDKGYLVTFRQVDPLFTLDLSDPANPRLVGELKIPGYSAYLHPMDNGHLLAVGMDGTDDGQLTGMQVSIFDVSDFANPRLAHKFALGDNAWTWSEALWNHHAFTYHNNRLAIPASYETHSPTDGWSYFSGLVVLDIDAEAGISEVGRIDHSDLASRMSCPAEYEQFDGGCDDFYRYNWQADMRRSIFIEDNLYSISNIGLKVSPLEQPEASFAEVMLVSER